MRSVEGRHAASGLDNAKTSSLYQSAPRLSSRQNQAATRMWFRSFDRIAQKNRISSLLAKTDIAGL